MNGVTVRRQQPLDFAADADAVLVGSGIRTREIAQDTDMLSRIAIDPSTQLVGAQCSGTLLLARLGLLGGLPACTDLTTKPWVIEAGVQVIDAPFIAHGNIATAGGCLSAQYLATWMIARLAGIAEAEEAMHYVAPVGQKDAYVRRRSMRLRATSRHPRRRRPRAISRQMASPADSELTANKERLARSGST